MDAICCAARSFPREGGKIGQSGFFAPLPPRRWWRELKERFPCSLPSLPGDGGGMFRDAFDSTLTLPFPGEGGGKKKDPKIVKS